MREAIELANPTEEYYAAPLEDNLFEWHFTVRGPPETEFEGGYYHGRILLPVQYPMQPPNIILLTPNGRFEVNKKICLSISGYHPETWQPSWSIRTALLALIAFMPSKGAGTIGSLDYTPEERQILARKSISWECPTCGNVADKLLKAKASPTLTVEESSMLETIALKAEEDVNRKEAKSTEEPEGLRDNANKVEMQATPFTLPQNDANNGQNSSLRQRNIPNITLVQQDITNDILETSNERNKRDIFWIVVIYVIVFLIMILIIRRVFFF
ncbi:hypothetical protein ABEB36_000531 [Hypothenemus hampei]|uniref:UBC core domain-containing protein n=1 Tax=Hypothenemus hampei TaxID=57062 RepID=A0ABD1FC53_HYPHA